MRMPAYSCYCLYIAMKNHFTQEGYDFFKYNGKVSASEESFLSRRDRYQFQKLCRICDETEMREYLVSNLIKDRKWVGDLLQEEARDNYKAYLKRKQSISYMFNNEVEKLFASTPDIRSIFTAGKGDYPKIIYAYLQGDVSLETFSILDEFINFSAKYDSKFGKDDILWSKIRILSKKLYPFIEYDKEKIKNILKEKIT